MSLQGAAQLRSRLKAIKLAFKPVGRTWAQGTARRIKATGPRRTGKGVSTVRVKNATQRKATVSAAYYMGILDKGSKAYDISPRKAGSLAFQGRDGRTVFSKKVHKPRQAPMGFAGRAAEAELRANRMAKTLIDEWNRAA